jgi:hypothetical protein
MLALLLATAAIPSCGDDAPSGPTREAYLEQAIPICEATQGRIDEASADIDQSTLEGRTAYVEVVADEVLATIAELRQLEAPSADAADLQRWFAIYEQRFGEWAANPEQALVGGLATDLTEAAAELEEYGLVACAGGAGGG